MPEMLTLTLPDGATREVEEGILPRDVVGSIGQRLLKDALAVEVDGEVQDLITPIRKSGSFRVLTAKDAKALDVLRHSGAHILATAVRRLRPDAKIGFGPSIEDGFYYDFEVEEPFTPEDLEKFEAEMRKVTRGEVSVRPRRSQPAGGAREDSADDPLKLERLAEFSDDEIISTYTDGPFIDLCRGPHVPGHSYRQALQAASHRRRLLARRREAADAPAHLRDGVLLRRTISKRISTGSKKPSGAITACSAQQLDLYSTDQRVGPGLILWHPRGAIVRNEIEIVRARR